jgi:hypothetical protein
MTAASTQVHVTYRSRWFCQFASLKRTHFCIPGGYTNHAGELFYNTELVSHIHKKSERLKKPTAKKQRHGSLIGSIALLVIDRHRLFSLSVDTGMLAL